MTRRCWLGAVRLFTERALGGWWSPDPLQGGDRGVAGRGTDSTSALPRRRPAGLRRRLEEFPRRNRALLDARRASVIITRCSAG